MKVESRDNYEWGEFQEPKTDMKQINYYQKDLTIKPLSNHYVFSKIFNLKYLVLTNFAQNRQMKVEGR